MEDQDMVWFKFSSPYDEIQESGRRHVAHAADSTAFVRREVADDASAKGAGQITEAPAEKKVDKAGTVIDRNVRITDPAPPLPPAREV